jgi:CBS-domain-containing membrane protein
MLTVRDVMTPSVITVHPEDSIKDVAQLLVDRQISGVPVVDAEGTVVGVVSEADFLIKEQGPDLESHRPLGRFLGNRRERLARQIKVEARTAGDLMSVPAIVIASGRPIHDAARVMTTRRVNRLPVVDAVGLVGIVTRADLVRAFARSDEELIRTIRDDVLFHVLWLDPNKFAVSVRDGVASIAGEVERRSTAELVRETVAMVPGIVDVDAHLEWSLDDSRIEPPTRDMVFPRGLG